MKRKIALPSPEELAARIAAAKKAAQAQKEKEAKESDATEEQLLPSVKAAMIAQQVERRKQQREAQLRRVKDIPSVSDNFAILDPRVNVVPAQRKPRSNINFVKVGKYALEGDKQRTEADVQRLIGAPILPIEIQARLYALHRDTSPIPDQESWDSSVGEIDNLVERPAVVLAPGAKKKRAPVSIPLMLTKKERKRIRREERQHRQEQERAKITLGLIPPPPPKVKLSNMARVYASEMVDNPTAVEEKVKAAMRERLHKHLAANEARKLNPEQARAKKLAKVAADKAKSVCVALYRVVSVSSRQQWKLKVNANQRHLSGMSLLLDGCNLVLVEGGPKAVAAYHKLMMRRIKWAEEDDDDDEEEEMDEELSNNFCALLWKGQVAAPSFKSFEVVPASSTSEARTFCENAGVLHYFSFGINYRGQ